MLPSARFFSGCALAAVAILTVGTLVRLPSWLVAVETLATILGLFVFA
jgi:hypothetical protein